MVGESAAVMVGRPGMPAAFARPLPCRGRHAARAARTTTLDLARETGLFLAVETGPDARYRVARAGPRWKAQLYLQDGTCSPQFFQIVLRMNPVAVGALPDGQRTLVLTSMAISAFIEETGRLAREAGVRFKLIRRSWRRAALSKPAGPGRA